MATSVIRIEGDSAHFQKVLSGVEGKISAVGEHIGSTFKGALAGAIGLEAIKKAAEETIVWSKSMVEVADETGTSLEDVLALDKAGKDHLITSEKLNKLLREANKNRQEALDNERKMLELKRLGLTEEQLKKGSPLDLVITAAKNSKSGAGLSDLVGQKNVSTVNRLRGELGDFGGFKAKGGIPNADDAEKLAEVWDQFHVYVEEAEHKLLPVIVGVFEAVKHAWQWWSDWIDESATGFMVFFENTNVWEMVKGIFSSFATSFVNTWRDNLKAVLDPFVTMWTFIKGTVEDYVTATNKIIHGHLAEAIETMKSRGAKALETGKEVVSEAVTASKKVITTAPRIFTGAADQFVAGNLGNIILARDATAEAEKENQAKRKKEAEDEAARLKLKKEERNKTYEPQKEIQKRTAVPSDALVSIGNFLGQSQITSIAEYQLDEQKKTNEKLDTLIQQGRGPTPSVRSQASYLPY